MHWREFCKDFIDLCRMLTPTYLSLNMSMILSDQNALSARVWKILPFNVVIIVVSPFSILKAHGAALISVSLALSRTPAEATRPSNTGPVHRLVCPFTPQLSLVLINRPRRDGTLSWRWYTAAVGGIRTHDPATSRSQVRHRTTRPLRSNEWH